MGYAVPTAFQSDRLVVTSTVKFHAVVRLRAFFRFSFYASVRTSQSSGRMSGQVSLHLIDLAVFALYMVVTIALGFWVARKGKDTARGYFLGNKTIPWFVVGASMVAADISSEQFISNVSVAYKYGIVPAAADWNAWIIYSLLILIFLPYYIRTGIYTMPEFLERRYNSACRYIFAVASLIEFIAAVSAGAPY